MLQLRGNYFLGHFAEAGPVLFDHHFQTLHRQPRMRGLVCRDPLLQNLTGDPFQLGMQPLEPLRKSFWRRLGLGLLFGLELHYWPRLRMARFPKSPDWPSTASQISREAGAVASSGSLFLKKLASAS